jgi:hypothetical protein
MILFTRHSDRAETPAHHRLEGGRVRERRWLLHGRSGSTDLASGDAGGAAMMRCDLCDGDKADASSRIVRPRNRHGRPLHNVHELFVACDSLLQATVETNLFGAPAFRRAISQRTVELGHLGSPRRGREESSEGFLLSPGDFAGHDGQPAGYRSLRCPPDKAGVSRTRNRRGIAERCIGASYCTCTQLDPNAIAPARLHPGHAFG